MKRSQLFVLLLFLSAHLGLAQADIEQEVNETVWKPFVESWSTFDAAAFNNLHTDDVLRASRRGLKVGKEYKQSNIESFARGAANKDKRMIHFWFEHRVYSGNMGYEVGYFKIVAARPGEKERSYYSRFHVVLKKVNGQWKIAQDWDTANINGHQVGEEDWLKGTPLEF